MSLLIWLMLFRSLENIVWSKESLFKSIPLKLRFKEFCLYKMCWSIIVVFSKSMTSRGFSTHFMSILLQGIFTVSTNKNVSEMHWNAIRDFSFSVRWRVKTFWCIYIAEEWWLLRRLSQIWRRFSAVDAYFVGFLDGTS